MLGTILREAGLKFVNLDTFISIDRKIARSVNLERDASNIEQIKCFQVTPMARRVLNRFVDSLEGEPQSAWSLTGPYGSGKSAFCNYLFALCSESRSSLAKVALGNLSTTDLSLKERFHQVLTHSRIKGFIPLRAVSQYESLNKTILRALNTALSEMSIKNKSMTSLKKQVLSLMEKSTVQTSETINVLQRANEISGKHLLIVVDEFGKNLEYLAHNPSTGDIFALQVLAESKFAYIMVCLHQAFGEYASSLSELQRNEWNKVQGRFEDISYLEPSSRVIDLIIKAMTQNMDQITHSTNSQITAWGDIHARLMVEVEIPGLHRLSEVKIKKLYPIHPLSAILLGELSHRFAQNDRTVFSFLSSGGPKTFSGYLSTHNINGEQNLPALGLDWLYDYFCEVATQIHGDRSTTQRWIETQTMISEHSNATFLELRLLKTIGVLNLLSQVPGICASKKMLHIALSAFDSESATPIDKMLDQLVSRGIVLFREYADEYRLWEGTDFDIEKAIREERARLALGTLEEMLEIAAPQASLVAARHSYQTGVVRSFTQSWTTLDLMTERNKCELIPNEASDGQIWLTLGKQKSSHELKEKTQGQAVIIGYASCEQQVVELALDAAASKKVFETHSQLAHDGVARREARFRAEAAANILHEFLTDLVSTTNKQMMWYACGKAQSIQSRHGLSSLISEVCDIVFHRAPHVHMEMINHNRLTSSAARAQRELIEAMVTQETDKNLSLEGFGPEVAIYRAMFKSPGLHTRISVDSNTWHFVRPEPTTPQQSKLLEVWFTLDNMLRESEKNNTAISFCDLIGVLQQSPYGLRKGPIPLFICHYIIVNDDEVALYQEGAFKPFFGKAEAALLLKRPDLFALRRFSSQGFKREVVQTYMMALNTDVLKLETKTRNKSLLKIVAPLVQFMKALPVYTRFTRRVSANAQKLRGAVLNSREPIELLFKNIPDAFGMPVFNPDRPADKWKKELHQNLQEALVELNGVFGAMNTEIQNSIMNAFGVEKGHSFPRFRDYLQKRAQCLVAPCRENELKTILKAMANINDDDMKWAQGVAGIVTKKPVDSWRDSDLDPWYAAIHEIADRIDAFEALVGKSTGSDDENRIILSLTRGDGETERRTLKVSTQDRKRLLFEYPKIQNLSKIDRERLCVILLEDNGIK